MQKIKPKTIEEYIQAAPAETIPKLIQLHETIIEAAPDSIENLKWGMPAYSYEKILVTFAFFKKHIGFYPMPSAMAHFEKKLGKYQTGKGSVQFPLDQPLPVTLIKQIVKFRVKESKEGKLIWRQ